MNTPTAEQLTPEMIKCLPEYRLTKLDLVKKYFILQQQEATNKCLIEGLTKQLEDKSFINACATPLDHPPQQQELMIILDPPENTELEEDNSNEKELQILELKSEIEGHFKINNELQQELEKVSTEKQFLIKKLNNIEKVLVPFRVLLNNEANGLNQYC